MTKILCIRLLYHVVAIRKHKNNKQPKFAAQIDAHIIRNDVYRVHTEMGIALTPSKLLASSQRNIFQSIFMKIHKPLEPRKLCNFDCHPDPEIFLKRLEAASTCWIGRQVFPRITIIKIEYSQIVDGCVVLCLTNRNCAVATYDPTKKLCTLRNVNFYSTTTIEETETTSSISIECFLHTSNSTRSSICRIENPTYDLLLRSANQQLQQITQLYKDRFTDLQAAYQFNLTAEKISRTKRAWSDFDFLEDIPLVGYLYRIIRSPETQ